MPLGPAIATLVADLEVAVGGDVLLEQDAVVAQLVERLLRAVLPVEVVDLADASRARSRAWNFVPPTPLILACVSRNDETAATPATFGHRRADRGRDRREAVVVEHRDVAGERAVDQVLDRGAQPVGEHRHEDDEREPDHQRGRGDRGAAGVARRVLAREPPDELGRALDRRGDDARRRADEARRDQRDAEDQDDRAAGGAEQLGRRVAALGQQARDDEAGAAEDAAARRAPGQARPAARASARVASRSASTGATRVARSAGASAPASVTSVPTSRQTMIVRLSSTRLVVGQVDAERLEQRVDRLGEAEARRGCRRSSRAGRS